MTRLLRGDVLSFARHYHGPLFHALLTDPPYGMEFMGKKWDGEAGWQAGTGFSKPGIGERQTAWPSHTSGNDEFGGANPTCARCGGRARGKRQCACDAPDWRVKGEKPDPNYGRRRQMLAYERYMRDCFAAFLPLLHPGAFGMAFASSRGWHRLACAIEDAGYIIHPSIFGWAFGSGFPKATRIDTAVDKAAGAERTQIERQWSGGQRSAGIMGNNLGTQIRNITAPATPLARAWAGHRYGLQAMKPALEPVIVFQKPYEGKPVECITRTGAGALWVDGGRVGAELVERGRGGRTADAMFCPAPIAMGMSVGRWPANFFLSDPAAAAALDRQSGESWSTDGAKYVGREYGTGNGVTYRPVKPHGVGFADHGGASRYFFRVAEQLDAADPVFYCAKASRREREAGLEAMPTKAFGQSGGAQKAIERGEAEYQTGDEVTTGLNTIKQRRCTHPTVKPLHLTRYLATLLLPPAEYAPRRIFCPFAGVMSEGLGAMQAGWEEVVGVEREAEYVAIGKARIKHYTHSQGQLL